MPANTFTPTWYSLVGHPLMSKPWTVYTVEVLGETCCTGPLGNPLSHSYVHAFKGSWGELTSRFAVPPKQMVWTLGMSSVKGSGSSKSTGKL